MPEVSPSRWLTTATWDDAPHLDSKTKRELLASTPPHLREARSQGIPSLGAGAIYPVPVSDIVEKPFQIPDYWPRGYGLDVGWTHPTAAVWVARDPLDGTMHAYAEYAKSEATAPIHAAAIRARGAWIRGAIDTGAASSSQADGAQLLHQYEGEGLMLTPANKAVDAGLYEIWQRLETGRLKIFSTLRGLLDEYRLYHRDERGRIVKTDDDRLDALRYCVMTFDAIARVRPVTDSGMPADIVADSHVGY